MNTKKNRFCLEKKRLGLLLKYGFKNIWKEMIILYAIIFVSFFLYGLYVRLMGATRLSTTFGTIIYGLFMAFITFSMIGCSIFLIINLYRSTTKNMFTDEGYLTFTLPVSTDELLFSKLIINLIFIFGTILTVVLGISVFFAFSYGISYGLYEFYSEIFSQIFGYGFIYVLGYTIETILDIILEIILLILSMSIVNSKCKGKNKNLIGIVLFIGIRYAVYSLMNVLATLCSFGFGRDINGNIQFSFGYLTSNVTIYAINFTSIIVYIASIIIMYAVSRFVLTRKLELLGE